MELARLEYPQVEINVNFQENSSKTFTIFQIALLIVIVQTTLHILLSRN